MLTINNLVKRYSEKTVVNIADLAIQKGETVGLVGNNGAGKTTFFRIILDLVKPNEGVVLSKNESVRLNDQWKMYTGSYLDEGFLIDYLTAEEYFEFVGKLHGLSKGDVEDKLREFHDFFNGEILKQKKYIRDFSKGNQKKIGIVAALLTNPEILILDEPFANLDPTSQIVLKNLLRKFKVEKQMTMLISSHDLNHVTEVCERIVILNKGEIVKDITTNKETLKELEEYFGVGIIE